MGWMKKEMGRHQEGVLRFIAACLLLLAACLIRTDSQTKILLDVLEEKATFRSIYIFVFQFYVVCVAAGYTFFQLIRCFFFSEEESHNLTLSKHLLLAITFLLDQMVAYVVFATNSASASGSLLAITGNRILQWEKVCNMYTRFCFQVGGCLAVGFLATVVLIYISALSGYRLFRFYSPTHFLHLKKRSVVKPF